MTEGKGKRARRAAETEEKRDRWVHVRVTEEERKMWKAKAEEAGRTLADYVREKMSAQQVMRRRQRVTAADPELVRAIARCGNNLNQIAKWCNTNKQSVESIEVIAALCSLERELKRVTAGNDS